MLITNSLMGSDVMRGWNKGLLFISNKFKLI